MEEPGVYLTPGLGPFFLPSLLHQKPQRSSKHSVVLVNSQTMEQVGEESFGVGTFLGPLTPPAPGLHRHSAGPQTWGDK